MAYKIVSASGEYKGRTIHPGRKIGNFASKAAAKKWIEKEKASLPKGLQKAYNLGTGVNIVKTKPHKKSPSMFDFKVPRMW
jgi:hypothetical protein